MISYPSIIPDPSLQKKWLHVCYKPPPVIGQQLHLRECWPKTFARIANAVPLFLEVCNGFVFFFGQLMSPHDSDQMSFLGMFFKCLSLLRCLFLSLPFLLVKPLNFCLVIISIVVYIATKYANAMCIYDVHWPIRLR